MLDTDQYVSDGTKTVLEILLEKHPEPLIPPAEALMEGEPVNVNPILFERLTPELIKNTCRLARGAAGPSGLDAEAWKRMITCFKKIIKSIMRSARVGRSMPLHSRSNRHVYVSF